MPDPRALPRVVDELVWSLRRAGLRVATSQAIDVARATAAVGWDDKTRLRDAIGSIVVHAAKERARYEAAFDAFFCADGAPRTLRERLLARGFTDSEVTALEELLEVLAAAGEEGASLAPLAFRGAELDRLLDLAGVARLTAGMHSALQVGFFAHKAQEKVGVVAARRALGALRAALVDALGDRGEILADAVGEELDLAAADVRAHVQELFARRQEAEARRGESLADKELALLTDAEVAEVRRAVRAFVLRLRGAERLRMRHARRGRFDVHRTLRRALATGGVPFVPARRDRRRDKARLVLLCDVSDSVRAVARFTLELTYLAQELFERTRSFVFVSELGETTELFASQPLGTAIAAAYGGGVVSTADNSNYGRVLRSFEARYLDDVDKRTTVVVVGDGRTNYHDDAADVLDRIRRRAAALLWLCPESPMSYVSGDSAMPRYAPRCTRVLEVRTAEDLENAAREMARRR